MPNEIKPWSSPSQDDNRDVVTLHAIQCHKGDFETPILEDEEQVYYLWDQHYNITGHTTYWTYTIQRGRGRIITPDSFRWWKED